MSITAKQYLIKSLGAELSREITAHDLEIVENKLNDVLAMFEVETTPDDLARMIPLTFADLC